ncbi:MAG: isopentenyl transferase family protein, partial [Candidatus Eremiobacterota bacterium]
MAYNLIVITGPTASGKTSLAVKLASVLDTDIISADSRQVYRGLDIGTGKDLSEYNIDGQTIPYHLIDIVEPQENFDLFCFYKSFFAIFKEFLKRGKIPILAGGTPLYIHSVIANYKLLEVPENNKLRKELSSYNMNELEDYLKSLQPALHNITDLEDRERLLRAIEIADFKLKNPDALSAGENIEIKPLIIGTLWERSILKK